MSAKNYQNRLMCIEVIMYNVIVVFFETQCISCKILVSIGPVLSVKKLRCVFTSWFGVFRRISPDILYRFLQTFHHIKALYMQMMNLYHIFQLVKGHCYGNQIMLP